MKTYKIFKYFCKFFSKIFLEFSNFFSYVIKNLFQIIKFPQIFLKITQIYYWPSLPPTVASLVSRNLLIRLLRRIALKDLSSVAVVQRSVVNICSRVRWWYLDKIPTCGCLSNAHVVFSPIITENGFPPLDTNPGCAPGLTQHITAAAGAREAGLTASGKRINGAGESGHKFLFVRSVCDNESTRDNSSINNENKALAHSSVAGAWSAAATDDDVEFVTTATPVPNCMASVNASCIYSV